MLQVKFLVINIYYEFNLENEGKLLLQRKESAEWVFEKFLLAFGQKILLYIKIKIHILLWK